MKRVGMVRCIVTATALAAGVGLCSAQDVVKVSPEHNKVKFENEHVRVVEKKLAPGEKDAMHRSRACWYYVTKPARLKVEFDDGEVQTWEPTEGYAGWLDPDAPHTYTNIDKTTLEMVMVEVKEPAKPQATPGSSAQATPGASGR